MSHQQIKIPTGSQEIKDILIALLAGIGYEGFEETEEGITAYIEQSSFDQQSVMALLEPMRLQYTTELIARQNWNEVWESNFKPVTVAGFCTVRASFHKEQVSTPYDIVINPKMSFGTGHHATTQLMMQLMQHLPFVGKSVLDFGAGTGILSILASKLGAEHVIAVDHEEWAAENAVENAALNDVENNIDVVLGSIENVRQHGYDIILANINRHILLQYMTEMKNLLKNTGTILMSGVLVEDESIIRAAATDVGFEYQSTVQKDNWIAITFTTT